MLLRAAVVTAGGDSESCRGITSCSQLKAAVANASCSSITIPCGTVILSCYGISVTRSVTISGEASCTGSCKQQKTRHHYHPPGNKPKQICSKPIIAGMGADVITANRDAIFTIDSTNSSSAVVVLMQRLVLANHSTTGEFLRHPSVLTNEFHLAAGINVLSLAAGPLGFSAGGFKLALQDMEFERLTGGGGAMMVKGEASAFNPSAPSELAVRGCKFTLCKASGWAGAGALYAHLLAGPVLITGSSFAQNSGMIFGAVSIDTVLGVQLDFQQGGDAPVRIENSTFVENHSGFVSGVFLESISARQAVVSNCRFIGNVGTGLYFKNQVALKAGDTTSTLTASKLLFQGNNNPYLSFEDHYAGGMFFWGPRLCLSDSVFAGNTGRAAGALEVGAVQFSGSALTFIGNSANTSTGPEVPPRQARGMANTLKLFSLGYESAVQPGINGTAVLSGCCFQRVAGYLNDVADVHVLGQAYGGNMRLVICQSKIGEGGVLLATTPAQIQPSGQPSIQLCGAQQPGRDYTVKPGSDVLAFDAAACVGQCSNLAVAC
jgi:hypothetical protein